jgi:hypothetical protein
MHFMVKNRPFAEYLPVRASCSHEGHEFFSSLSSCVSWLRGSEMNKCPNCAGFLFAFEAQK